MSQLIQSEKERIASRKMIRIHSREMMRVCQQRNLRSNRHCNMYYTVHTHIVSPPGVRDDCTYGGVAAARKQTK